MSLKDLSLVCVSIVLSLLFRFPFSLITMTMGVTHPFFWYLFLSAHMLQFVGWGISFVIVAVFGMFVECFVRLTSWVAYLHVFWLNKSYMFSIFRWGAPLELPATMTMLRSRYFRRGFPPSSPYWWWFCFHHWTLSYCRRTMFCLYYYYY